MRIVQLVPGSGGSFYCENCLRDAGLVRELRRGGHDISMVPLYLPISADGGMALADAPVFFGGINVYLQQKLALFRHTPRWLDKLFDSPALLRAAGRKAGMTSAADLAETTLSMLRGARGRQSKELDRLIAYLKEHERPDVVVLSNALLLGLAARVKRELGAAVLVLLQDEDIFLDALGQPHSETCWAALAERARAADAFVAVSRYYAEAMIERLSLPADRVRVVHSGIELEAYAPSAAPPEPPAIGYLDRMCPEKGLDILIDALALLKQTGRHDALRLRISGGQTAADEPYIRACRRRIAEANLAASVDFFEDISTAGRLEFLRSVTCVCVPSRHKEAFGLYALEAWATGRPVVLPPEGAFPELIEASGGGLLAEANEPRAIAEALDVLLSDAHAAAAMGAAGRAAVEETFNVRRMAGEFLDACRWAAERTLTTRNGEARG